MWGWGTLGIATDNQGSRSRGDLYRMVPSDVAVPVSVATVQTPTEGTTNGERAVEADDEP